VADQKQRTDFTGHQMKYLFAITVLLAVVIGEASVVRAQVPPPMPAYQTLADAQLDQLLGPIALYPDPLIAQILPASTMPAQIVLADRYVTGGGDLNLIDQQPWDSSIQALARYPNVLKWMDDNLNWTTELGVAFLNQQPEVMSSIQRLRAAATHFGNLQSTPQQQVMTDDGDIEIVPADPAIIYVPVYQPDQVYFGSAFGSPFITFSTGWPMGLWLDGDFDWRNHHLLNWDRGHPRPANWWHEPARQRNFGNATVWHSGNRARNFQSNRGDRGWNGTSPARTTAPGFNRQQPTRQAPQQNHEPVINARQPTPAPAQPLAPASRPEPNGAFIGVQSSHDTRTYSNRGQQSIQSIPRSAPVSRSATVSRSAPITRPAPAMPSGGGGGNNPNNQRKR
jgi:hypothetical protein